MIKPSPSPIRRPRVETEPNRDARADIYPSGTQQASNLTNATINPASMASRQGATREAARKRAVEEVVPAAFVAREDEGGAYGMLEMPKRFVHGYVADKGRLLTDPRVRAFELDDAQFTAQQMRVTSFVDDVFRMMDKQDAERAAAKDAAAEHVL